MFEVYKYELSVLDSDFSKSETKTILTDLGNRCLDEEYKMKMLISWGLTPRRDRNYIQTVYNLEHVFRRLQEDPYVVGDYVIFLSRGYPEDGELWDAEVDVNLKLWGQNRQFINHKYYPPLYRFTGYAELEELLIQNKIMRVLSIRKYDVATLIEDHEQTSKEKSLSNNNNNLD